MGARLSLEARRPADGIEGGIGQVTAIDELVHSADVAHESRCAFKLLKSAS
jgi:hypothetical protein